MAMCARCGTTLCLFEMKTGICQNCEAIKRNHWDTHQRILTLFCKAFDDDEILAYLQEHRSELLKSIEQAAMTPLEDELKIAEQFVEENTPEPPDTDWRN